jgi:uncharacterized phage-associated protein
MATVFDVAKYILRKTNILTTYKLQKLVYYSQAWSLVFDDEPIFNEKIYAWANGPVCKRLYNVHQGLFQISESDLRAGDITKLSKKQKATIDMVLKGYGTFSGQQLSNLTHQEMPWRNARKGLKPNEIGEKEISLDDMYQYYYSSYNEQIK